MMGAMSEPILRVQDLSVAFRGKRVVEACPSPSTAARPWRWSANRQRQVGHRAVLPAPAARRRREPGGRITLDGTDVLAAEGEALRRLRGGVAGMVFQEPMTSLNPLHSVGRQVSEAVTLHRPLHGDALRAGCSSCCAAPASPARRTGWRLSAPALGRPAPARDDRGGARQRPDAADRRRADHRARRHDPGADPGTCWPTLKRRLAWRAADHPRPAIVRRHAERVW
jgi:hypothetical protein